VTLTGCTAHDIELKLRFGWPTGVTHQADRMRTLWTWSSVAALVVGVIVWGLIFWCCWRYRKTDDLLPAQTKYHLPIEIAYSIAPFVIIAVLFYFTAVTEDYVDRMSPNPDTVVQVDAFKWNWRFEYHHAQGSTSGSAVSTTYAGQKDVTTGVNTPLYLNTIGSDTEIPVLVVPKGETVQIIEHSDDVVHSFWVPEFLFKRDVIPYGSEADQRSSGLHDNRFEFTATSEGSFVGRCAELCGTYHAMMNFEVRVVSPQVFTGYLAALKQLGPDDPARQAKALAQAKVPGGAFATTTVPYKTDRTSRSASGG
jgi:cytochrome c oxidase subunit 2